MESISGGLLGMAVVATMGITFGGVLGLTMDYYSRSCPLAEATVRNAVAAAVHSDPTLAAGILRMHFHDCFIQGCDGSVLIDSTENNTAEKDSPANLSLRGYEVIDEAKRRLEQLCPAVVSCADILAMAARDVVFFSGGPFYVIPQGRMDGRGSRIADTAALPAPTMNGTELVRAFGQRGFSSRELVALSGGHTLGAASCATFKARLSSSDPALDPTFARQLTDTCSGGDAARQPFDATRNAFDAAYFGGLTGRRGVLFSDQALFTTPETRGVVRGYAFNPAMFFFDFQRAIVKMGSLDVKDASTGEVRRNCRRIN